MAIFVYQYLKTEMRKIQPISKTILGEKKRISGILDVLHLKAEFLKSLCT